jgi:hypothetical protein
MFDLSESDNQAVPEARRYRSPFGHGERPSPKGLPSTRFAMTSKRTGLFLSRASGHGPAAGAWLSSWTKRSGDG